VPRFHDNASQEHSERYLRDRHAKNTKCLANQLKLDRWSDVLGVEVKDILTEPIFRRDMDEDCEVEEKNLRTLSVAEDTTENAVVVLGFNVPGGTTYPSKPEYMVVWAKTLYHEDPDIQTKKDHDQRQRCHHPHDGYCRSCIIAHSHAEFAVAAATGDRR